MLLPLIFSVFAPPAQALTLSETDRSTLAPGVELVTYRTESPTTDTHVLEVDLCEDGIRLDATRTPTSTRTVASWAGDYGPVAAINGDFYRTSPVRVYGDAVGGGVQWPSIQTGTDSAYAGEWYYGDFGWVAFLQDEVTFTHSGWAKDNASTLGLTAGHDLTVREPTAPDGTMALVSGFPAVVIEGTAMICSDPTSSNCFPDRTDMRTRNPRTAIGLSSDFQTLYLAVVDGRSSRSSGMYGSELADLMEQLGAWQAFNLDGGGSSTLWTSASGVVNTPSDGYARSTANHPGVFATPPTGSSTRPWHCVSEPPCASISPEGATLDEAGDCFTPSDRLSTCARSRRQGKVDHWSGPTSLRARSPGTRRGGTSTSKTPESTCSSGTAWPTMPWRTVFPTRCEPRGPSTRFWSTSRWATAGTAWARSPLLRGATRGSRSKTRPAAPWRPTSTLSLTPSASLGSGTTVAMPPATQTSRARPAPKTARRSTRWLKTHRR